MTVRTASGDVTLETRVATTEGEAAEGPSRCGSRSPASSRGSSTPWPRRRWSTSSSSWDSRRWRSSSHSGGFGFAGFGGIGLVALAVYGLTVATPSWPWLAVLLVGIGLLMLDVRLRSLSWPTWIGLGAFGVGSVLAWGHVDPSVRISPWLIGGAIVASLLYYGFALTVALQSRDRIVGTARADRARGGGARAPRRTGRSSSRAPCGADGPRGNRSSQARRPGPGRGRVDPPRRGGNATYRGIVSGT